MKPSEVFRKAIQYKIPQSKGTFKEKQGRRLAYCAAGLLCCSRYAEKVSTVDYMVFRTSCKQRTGYSLYDLNDKQDWKWKDFAELAERIGL